MNKLFFKRVGAFFIDCTILFVAMLFIGLLIPSFGDTEKLANDSTAVIEKYINEEITAEEFQKTTENLNYDLTKATYLTTIVGIVVYLLYFVVYSFYNNGQTLGKKRLKIRVSKQDGSKLDINSLLIRSLIPYGILSNLILVILILILPKNTYINIESILSTIHSVLLTVLVVMMVFKSRGLHDVLAKTEVTAE